MNRYPWWKYLILAIAVVAGLLYTLPNFFGEAPAVQVSSGKATLKVDAGLVPRVEQALQAGAKGFLSKRCSPEELIAAVRTAAQGGCYLTPDIAHKLASSHRDPLTNREREVAQLLAGGMEVKAIAERLGLSPKTVHVHRANLMDKLNVNNNVELAHRMLDSW